ncbi:30S ribosomal protein S6 [candidate division WOR-3 bacterium]|nr:30S ribosomal protein S6 [candidate division WOR-3 bacterium]
MRSYENIVIFAPTLEEDIIEKELKKIEAMVQEHKGEVGSIDRWGKKKLAYPIKKSETGYYVLLNLELEPETVKMLDTEYKLNQNILRHSIITKEEYARV